MQADKRSAGVTPEVNLMKLLQILKSMIIH